MFQLSDNEKKELVAKCDHLKDLKFTYQLPYAITESNDPKQYIQRIKSRDEALSEGWVQIVHTLEIETTGGKQRMNCANTKGIFRLIQSIPSKSWN